MLLETIKKLRVIQKEIEQLKEDIKIIKKETNKLQSRCLDKKKEITK